jgi:hypothetical protein
MKSKLLGIITIVLLLSLGIQQIGAVSTTEENESETTDLPIENPLWLRLRNRIRDTLGICDSVCQASLEELTGILSYDGIYYFIDNVEVHFGPIWYIKTTKTKDFDGDGTIEFVFDELQGLLGETVTMQGYYQSDNWFSVFIINDSMYRDLGRPIWAGGHGNGP